MCYLCVKLFIIKMKNAIFNLKKINIDICDFKWEQIIYDLNITDQVFDTEKGMLSGYKLYPVVL